MKIFLRHLMLTLGLLSGLFLFSHATDSSAISSPFVLTPPQEVFDLNDLDVRDELNRPIQSAAIRKNFEQLWNSSLAQLLVNGLTPTLIQLYKLMQISWERYKSFFKKVIFIVQGKIWGWLRSDNHLRFFSSDITWMLVPPLNVQISLPSEVSHDHVALIVSTTRILR